jgi:hypothetical protein
MFIKWYFTQLELWNADWKFKMAAKVKKKKKKNVIWSVENSKKSPYQKTLGRFEYVIVGVFMVWSCTGYEFLVTIEKANDLMGKWIKTIFLVTTKQIVGLYEWYSGERYSPLWASGFFLHHSTLFFNLKFNVSFRFHT